MADRVAGQFVPSDDARVFLGRLTRLDPMAVVRLRPVAAIGSSPSRVALWACLPWGTLVTREVEGPAPGDATVAASALLDADDGQLPQRRDSEWRWPLPPEASEVMEEIPAETLRQVATAAAGTLRDVSAHGLAGRTVGVRVLREALLDHVPIVVSADGDDSARIEVPQRLVQAMVRMGFLGAEAADEPSVRVRVAGRWVGLSARYGTAWLPPKSGPLTVLTG
ncbi:hypothetical protein JQS43_19135 [Natronosporangium hydrolyticum]|uniref:Uncharacterized protein n=1 Tax=Natronosporangium hydrolyticum TaxID=2811111 RepID=A0A895Y8K3_9ACTN|nr:hypothetical protein [Natronosporangium hydrolyticum]QSB13671.1 hypothetical protein JQS43_19135 [Natronosporangium hydrolyticum]